MLKDITLGQYFPGNSVIHRLDPRTKLIVLVVYMVTLFVASGWVSYGVLLLFLLAVIKISSIPGKSIVRGMKPLVMILVFTGVLNLFFTKEGRVLVDFWGVTITTGGAERSGMGFTIMESFMTNLEITSKPGKGTTVHMRRKLQRRQ